MSFFTLLFFFQFFEHFSDFFGSIFLQNQNFHGFILLFLLSCSLSFFFSLDVFVKAIWWQRTKHVTKRNEWSQWWQWSTKSEKEVFCWRVFSAWTKVSVDGPESTKENALADDFWLGLAAIVCFLWLSELCVTQTVRGTPASECSSSSPYVLSLSLSTFTLFMFTLLPQHVATSYWKDWPTWGGEAEPGRLSGLCRRSQEEGRAGNTKNWAKTTPWHGRGNKQTGR